MSVSLRKCTGDCSFLRVIDCEYHLKRALAADTRVDREWAGIDGIVELNAEIGRPLVLVSEWT